MAPSIPELHELGLDEDAKRVDALAREVLGDDYTHFQIESVQISDDINSGDVRVAAALRRSGTGEALTLEGVGVGVVDGFFEGVMRAFAAEYPSLKTISVDDFSLDSGFDEAAGRRSDALAVATLRMKNSVGKVYSFENKSPSITRSSVRAALDALTFFLNSERAYVKLHFAVKDAKERRRSDLQRKYRQQMAILLKATSYSEVIEKLKAEKLELED